MSDLPGEEFWVARDLNPGIFFYYFGKWYFTLGKAHRSPASSWPTIEVVDADGRYLKRFRLLEEHVPVRRTPPESFTPPKIRQRTDLIRRRLAVWQREIDKLERLEALLRDHTEGS